jgi:hypothetical protein
MREHSSALDWRDAALLIAGILGSAVVIVHGVLTQRLMVRPFQALAATQVARPIRRLIPGLLHFSTFNWFVGGLALIVAAGSFELEARRATGLLVGWRALRSLGGCSALPPRFSSPTASAGPAEAGRD